MPDRIVPAKVKEIISCLDKYGQSFDTIKATYEKTKKMSPDNRKKWLSNECGIEQELHGLDEYEVSECIKFFDKISPSTGNARIKELVAKYFVCRMASDVRRSERGAYDPYTEATKIIPLLAEAERVQLVFYLLRIYPAGLYVPTVFGNYFTDQYISILEKLFGQEFVITLDSCIMALDRPVLITGETGTGKELFAHAIHLLSDRRAEPFVAVNTSGLPATLIESDLFGHKKGAFTGAINDRAGYLKSAGKGTLFLDEIGDMPVEAQTRLLRVLNDNKFVAVGDDPSKTQNFEARIICATNRDIPSLIKQQKFREDLYYRINTFHLDLPPLRSILNCDSEATKIDLFHHFLMDVKADLPYLPDFNFATGEDLTSEALKKLSSYHFPGNYRELNSVLTRSINKFFISLALGKNEWLARARHHFSAVKPDSPMDELRKYEMCLLEKMKLDADSIDLPNNYYKCLNQQTDSDIDVNSLNYKENLDAFQKKLIIALLRKHEGIVRDAAEDAGFGRSKNAITKFTKLAQKYGIKWQDYRKALNN